MSGESDHLMFWLIKQLSRFCKNVSGNILHYSTLYGKICDCYRITSCSNIEFINFKN
jgi:hypothetical protein